MICITCYDQYKVQVSNTNGRRARPLNLNRHANAFLLPRTLVHYLSRLPISMPSHGDSILILSQVDAIFSQLD